MPSTMARPNPQSYGVQALVDLPAWGLTACAYAWLAVNQVPGQMDPIAQKVAAGQVRIVERPTL
jgi:hypothetical protein